MRVLKFGGTSVANAERFLRVADILENNARQGQVATVLSAPAKITNHLVAMIEKTIGGLHALTNIGIAHRQIKITEYTTSMKRISTTITTTITITTGNGAG